MPDPLAIGCDIEQIARFADKASDARFLARVYTPGEIAYCLARKHPAAHLAARFCAKEACLKALRSLNPATPSIRLNAIEVQRAPGQAPGLYVAHPAVAQVSLQLSLSHTRDTAMAVVLARPAAAEYESRP